MLESFPVALTVGAVLGFLSGLGIGGGSLLILWLTMVLGMEHSAARCINLLFFLPTATIACFLQWRAKAIPFRRILPAALGGCLAAAVLSRNRIGPGGGKKAVRRPADSHRPAGAVLPPPETLLAAQRRR